MGVDPIEFPDEWLSALHPRRSGRRGWVYQVTDEQRELLRQVRPGVQAELDAILDNPLTDSRYARLARSPQLTVEAAGVRLALDRHLLWRHSAVVVADQYVQALGVPSAAAACVESGAYSVVYGHQLARAGRGHALVAADALPPDPHNETFRGWIPLELVEHLRRLLSVGDEPTWQATAELLARYRTGSPVQRAATSYLLPDRRDWVSADLAAIRGALERRHLLYSAFAADQLQGFVVSELREMVTVLDAVGHDALPLLLRSFHWHFVDREARQRILDVLARLPSAAALDGLLARTVLADVPAAFEAAAARQPERALEVLLARPDEPFTAALLARHRKRFPVADDGDRLPVADGAAVPAILTAPPWTRPQPRPVTVEAPDIGVQLHWLDGERERWSWDRWPDDPPSYDAMYAERPDWARFYLGGSPEKVRPLLATWAAEKCSFYLDNPKLLVAKYDLDAYPPALRLARAKPVLGAELMLPFLSADVAQLMAGWLAGSRQFRPVAEQWFARHGSAGVVPLVPLALGKATAQGRAAALALTRLDPDVVRAAGDELGCRDAVEVLLARDPLDVLPGRVPALPAWLELDVLPDVLTSDRRYRLGGDELGVLCRLLAMSQLDDPYAGLQVLAAALDGRSLAAFAWALFSHWHVVDRPAKDAWAMDALGHFGDAEVADRLAPLVRRWPTDGAAQRAKRGVEVLGRIDSPAALRHLAAIARNAKSTPLRKHAAQVLDRAAADRGMLPEQLEDVLAPDLGLDGEPVWYRGLSYRPDLGDTLELVLRDASGALVTTLPKPSGDDEKATANEWNKRRRAAKTLVADQVRRLEEAMIVQRRWTAAEFAGSVAAHPLLGRLARRLVWSVDGRLAGVDELGDLVDVDGGLLPVAAWVHVAHPADADLGPWRVRFAARGVSQPFPQLDRDVHQGDPSQHWGDVVTAASLYALTRRGWHWSAAGRAATRTQLIRPFGAAGSVVLRIQPGVSAVHDAAGEPGQTIEEIALHSAEHAELAVFGDLPRVTRSELLRDLAALSVVRQSA